MESRLTIQGRWNGHEWGITDTAISGLSAMSRLRSLKAVQQKDVAGRASLNKRGMEPFSCSLSWRLSASAGNGQESFCRDEITSWERDIGSTDYLEIGGVRWHDRPLCLVSVQSSDVQMDTFGRILWCQITASFSEVVEETAKARRSPVRGVSEATKRKLGISSGSKVGPSTAEKQVVMGGRK